MPPARMLERDVLGTSGGSPGCKKDQVRSVAAVQLGTSPPSSVGATAAAPSRPFADCEVFLPRCSRWAMAESTKPGLIPLAWLEGVCALHNSFGVIN